jgi:hypothetical protein
MVNCTGWALVWVALVASWAGLWYATHSNLRSIHEAVKYNRRLRDDTRVNVERLERILNEWEEPRR